VDLSLVLRGSHKRSGGRVVRVYCGPQRVFCGVGRLVHHWQHGRVVEPLATMLTPYDELPGFVATVPPSAADAAEAAAAAATTKELSADAVSGSQSEQREQRVQ
jgi:hypothetical protein